MDDGNGEEYAQNEYEILSNEVEENIKPERKERICLKKKKSLRYLLKQI